MVLLKTRSIAGLRHLNNFHSSSAPSTQQKLYKTAPLTPQALRSFSTNHKIQMYLTAEEELKVEDFEEEYEEECQEYMEEEVFIEEEVEAASDEDIKSWFKGVLLMKYTFISLLYAYYNL